MRITIGLLIPLILLTFSASPVLCGVPRVAASSPRSEVAVIDGEMRMVLSNADVLKTMHGLSARHGMSLIRITRKPENGSMTAFEFTFMGGIVPQNTGTFTVRTALEGPPPVTLSVTHVSHVTLNFVPEGPPPLARDH